MTGASANSSAAPVDGVVVAAARRFVAGCSAAAIAPLGRGLINDSYRVDGAAAQDGRARVVQRLNTRVFGRPQQVMENIVRVTKHLQAKSQRRHGRDDGRRYLRLCSTCDGAPWWVDPNGAWWRCFWLVPNAQSLAGLDSDRRARQAGEAFGRFAADLTDLPGPPLHLTIAGFHDTVARLAALEQAFAAASSEAGLGPERDEVWAHADLAEQLAAAAASGRLPERVVHNDTKVDNLLFDRDGGEALCVIDLDTVMPGSLVHDFGDLVRNGCAGPWDGTAVGFNLARFGALAEGYIARVGHCLTAVEAAFLADAGRLMAVELAARFLTDHLSGDGYFKTDYRGHNLDRCRVQLGLARAMRQVRPVMVEQVEALMERLADRPAPEDRC